MPDEPAKNDIPPDAEILIATDMVRSIVEGDTALAAQIMGLSRTNPVILLRGCLCDGLASSVNPSSAGLRALAEILAVAR